jgi:hypothetical protein
MSTPVQAAVDGTRVKTGEAILSYPNIAHPQTNDEGKEKYSGSFVFAPGTDKKPYQSALMTAAKEFFGEKVKIGKVEMTLEQAIAAKEIAWPIREDVEKKGYAPGSFFINASSNRQPGCVYNYASKADPTRAAAIPQDKLEEDLYPGCYVRVSLNAYGYDRKGKKGVTFGLDNVQKLREGERIDGRPKPEDDFSVDLSQPPVDIKELTS